MALSKKQKTAYQNTKKQIRLTCKEIQEKSLDKINKALSCGALDENSDFLEPNSLLARTIIEDVVSEYELKFPPYRKEADNLKKFL